MWQPLKLIHLLWALNLAPNFQLTGAKRNIPYSNDSLQGSYWKNHLLIYILNRSSLKVKVIATQLCPTLCNLMDYIVHGILQVRILEWVAFPFSRGSSQPRDQTQVSHTAGSFFTSWATREVCNKNTQHTSTLYCYVKGVGRFQLFLNL